MFLEVQRPRKGPEWPQNGFNMGPRRPMMGQDTPRLEAWWGNMGQDAAKMARGNAKMGQDSLKMRKHRILRGVLRPPGGHGSLQVANRPASQGAGGGEGGG